MNSSHLKQLQWAVRATLGLGVTVSIAANVLHARPDPISQTIAGWPPVALLLTVELISRVPVTSRSLAAIRIAATTVIAGIAGWVSYWHMVGVAARYGETGASPYLLPLCVDGLIVVASICLVELSTRLQTHTTKPTAASGMITASPPQPAATAPTNEPQPPGDDPPPPPIIRATPAPTAEVALPSPHRRAPKPVRHLTDHESPDHADDNTVYQPTSDADKAMYDAWREAAASGRMLSGADLARAAGRSNDSTGAGRRAARRYRTAHDRATPHAAFTDGKESPHSTVPDAAMTGAAAV